jgi:TrmH family RNA methyltransferase
MRGGAMRQEWCEKIKKIERDKKMISKTRANFIISLQKKKVRDDEKLFIIEGDKLVKEFLYSGIRIKSLIAKPEFIGSLTAKMKQYIEEIEPASYEELKKISTLKTPHNAMAIVPVFSYSSDFSTVKNLTVALDFVQDPGNMGTIIRAAAWFGISDIYCSNDCVDVYNPKVVQATMGAILNVRVRYCDLKELLKHASENSIPVFGALLEGESVYGQELEKDGIILLGNESKGISEELLPFISHKLLIPRFTDTKYGVESLNVGMAASIIFSEFARRQK